MAYYWTCPECGSNNDPGEACDCQAEKEAGLLRWHGNSPRHKDPYRS